MVDWLISHIPKPAKRSVNHAKEKIMGLFQINTDGNIDYKPNNY